MAEEKKNVEFNQETIENIMKYKNMSKLKKAAMNLLVKQLQPTQYIDLYSQFSALDQENDGFISAKDLMQAVEKLGLRLCETEIDC